MNIKNSCIVIAENPCITKLETELQPEAGHTVAVDGQVVAEAGGDSTPTVAE